MTGHNAKLMYAGWMILVLLVSSCALSSRPGNRYQLQPVSSQSVTGPVAELQRKAINALAADNSRASIEFLQRAIKIKPRDAVSWHYLALSYWQEKNYEKCLAMLERSLSYSNPVDDLESANQKLRQQCANR